MSKSLFKLALITGIALTPFKCFSMDKGMQDDPSKTPSAPRHGQNAKDKRNKLFDQEDEKEEVKTANARKEFPAELGQAVLNAPVKRDSTGRKFKTQRVYYKDRSIWVSATFTDLDELETLKAALSPTFATFIEENGDYESPEAKHFFEAAVENIKRDSSVSVHPKVTFAFVAPIDLAVDSTDTAKLVKEKKRVKAATDHMMYRAMVGDKGKEKEIRYFGKAFWLPATLKFNITYEEPKPQQSPPLLLELPKISPAKPAALKRPSIEKKPVRNGAPRRALDREDAEQARRKAVMILPRSTLPASAVFRLLTTRSIKLKPEEAKMDSVVQQYTLKTVDNREAMLGALCAILGTNIEEINTISDVEINLKFPDLIGKTIGDPEDYDFGKTAALARQHGPADEVLNLYEIFYKGQAFTYILPGLSSPNKAKFTSSVTTHHEKAPEDEPVKAESNPD